MRVGDRAIHSSYRGLWIEFVVAMQMKSVQMIALDCAIWNLLSMDIGLVCKRDSTSGSAEKIDCFVSVVGLIWFIACSGVDPCSLGPPKSLTLTSNVRWREVQRSSVLAMFSFWESVSMSKSLSGLMRTNMDMARNHQPRHLARSSSAQFIC